MDLGEALKLLGSGDILKSIIPWLVQALLVGVLAFVGGAKWMRRRLFQLEDTMTTAISVTNNNLENFSKSITELKISLGEQTGRVEFYREEVRRLDDNIVKLTISMPNTIEAYLQKNINNH